MVVCQPV